MEPEVAPPAALPVVIVPKGNPDTDNDGVLNVDDACKNTAENAQVNERGCAVLATIELKIQFDSNQSVLKPEYFPELNEVASVISQHSNIEVTIEGHTDSQGSAEHNELLSEQRAEAAADYLMRNSTLAPDRFKIVGHGERFPIADNSLAAGRKENRRVMLIIHRVD